MLHQVFMIGQFFGCLRIKGEEMLSPLHPFDYGGEDLILQLLLAGMTRSWPAEPDIPGIPLTFFSDTQFISFTVPVMSIGPRGMIGAPTESLATT